jgi:hypothetical protein
MGAAMADWPAAGRSAARQRDWRVTRQSDDDDDDGYRAGVPGMGVGLAADWERGAPRDAPSSDFSRRVDGDGMLRRGGGPAAAPRAPHEVAPATGDLSKGHKV